MNEPLLREISRQILRHPLQFDMAFYFANRFHLGITSKNCGTAACIAGWGKVITARKLKAFTTASSVLTDLPINREEMEEIFDLTKRQYDRLVYEAFWPARFKRLYRAARQVGDSAKGARLAAQRIEYFICTNGRS
jgi:hypothetical protein